MRTLSSSLVLALLWGCTDEQPATKNTSSDVAYRAELVQIAAKAVHKFPLNPHVKNRSRAQERVAAACLKIDRPELALACLEKIANWRKGTALADYALYMIDKGDKEEARQHLAVAVKIAKETADPNQRWRTDRVRAKVARAYLALDDLESAASVAKGLVDSESGTVLAAQTKKIEAEDLGKHLKMLEKVAGEGTFDQLNGVMDALVVLFDKFYDDAKHRDLIEVRVKDAFSKLPVEVRLKRLTSMVDVCLEHGDKARGQSILQEASNLFNTNKWLPEKGATERARLAAYWFRVGKPDAAKQGIERARKEYDDNLAKIVNIYRAGVLRQIAEALKVSGDEAAALATYKEAVEAGLENPNSRPRADDLAATCCSMAVFKVRPDATLRARLTQTCDLLRDPW